MIIDYPFSNPSQLTQFTNEAVEEMIGEGGLAGIISNFNFSSGIQTPAFQDSTNTFELNSYSILNRVFLMTYGYSAGRGLALRTGRLIFSKLLRNHPDLDVINSMSFRVKPLSQKVALGLPIIAEMMDSSTGQKAAIEEYEKEYHYIVHQCSDCTGLKDEKQPACYLTMGILKEALYWLSGSHEFRITESECMAMNDACCRFVIPKQPL